MSYNEKRLAKTTIGMYGFNHNGWSYVSTADDLATIAAVNYFDAFAKEKVAKVNDLFLITGSDSTQMYIITASSSTEITIMPFNGAIIEKTVDLTSAEVLLLRAAPKTLVTVPGADKFLQFVDAHLILNYATTQYTESADNLAIKYTDGSGSIVSETIECTGFIDQAADTITNAIAVKDTIVAASGAVNKALVIHNVGDGEFAVGDSPIQVVIHYRVLNANLA